MCGPARALNDAGQKSSSGKWLLSSCELQSYVATDLRTWRVTGYPKLTGLEKSKRRPGTYHGLPRTEMPSTTIFCAWFVTRPWKINPQSAQKPWLGSGLGGGHIARGFR